MFNPGCSLLCHSLNGQSAHIGEPMLKACGVASMDRVVWEQWKWPTRRDGRPMPWLSMQWASQRRPGVRWQSARGLETLAALLHPICLPVQAGRRWQSSRHLSSGSDSSASSVAFSRPATKLVHREAHARPHPAGQGRVEDLRQCNPHFRGPR